MSDKYDFTFKLLFIGDAGVGKTSLFLRFAYGTFTANHLTTIGLDFKIKKMNIEGKLIKLQIWDTAGQEYFRTLTKSYYKGANGIILTYDVTDENSFKNIRNWIKQIEANSPPNVRMVLVGNKCDKPDRVVTEEEGKKLADDFGINFFETSAKTNQNVTEVFQLLTQEILKGNEINTKEFIPNSKRDIQIPNNQNDKDLLQQLNDEKLKNKKLEDEILKLKTTSQNQLDELNTLRNDIKKLQNENNDLKQRLSITNQSNKINQMNQMDINEINNLKQIIIQKDKEINELKSKIPKHNVNMDDIMVINFLSKDQNIRCGISCLADDTFAEVEEKLYKKFDEFRNTNNILLFKGNIILRFKKVKENDLHDGDTILIQSQ